MRILTDWFPVGVNPVRKGFYLTAAVDSTVVTVRYWTGAHWELSGFQHAFPPLMWAGLAFNPAAAVESVDAESPNPLNPRRGWWVPQP